MEEGQLQERRWKEAHRGRWGKVYMQAEDSLSYEHPSALAESSFNHKDTRTLVLDRCARAYVKRGITESQAVHIFNCTGILTIAPKAVDSVCIPAAVGLRDVF